MPFSFFIKGARLTRITIETASLLDYIYDEKQNSKNQKDIDQLLNK